MEQLELVEQEQEIRESLILLFSTRPGERITYPDFGCDIHHLILEPQNATLRSMIDVAIREAVLKFEPRIDITDINIDYDDVEGVVYVGMEYVIRKINVRTNIVYPFYKLEGTELSEID